MSSGRPGGPGAGAVGAAPSLEAFLPTPLVGEWGGRYFLETDRPDSIGRMPLGVVPVEPDGSVYCEAPVGKAIYFQLLDEKGMAVHSMRSTGSQAKATRSAALPGAIEPSSRSRRSSW